VCRAATFVAQQFISGAYSIQDWVQQPLNPKVANEDAIDWSPYQFL
jgi:hypothetical protein